MNSMCIVAYLSAETSTVTEVSFIIGKCRNTPMKQQAIDERRTERAHCPTILSISTL